MLKRVAWCALLASALLCFQSALVPAAAQPASTSPPADWKLFRYPEYHVMFRAPASAPLMVKQETAARDLEAHYHIAFTERADGVFMVDVYDETADSRPLSIDAGIANVLKRTNSHLIGPVRTVAVQYGQVREYEAASDKFLFRVRDIVAGRWLYQAEVMSFTSTLPADTDAFLSSLTPLP